MTVLVLPEYENPPVTEVVCGILFKPIGTLLAPHLGLLWDKFRADYPHCREVAPLTPVIERFDESPAMDMEITDVPPLPRIWFTHVNNQGIIQVQRDRFLHNWRKVRPTDEYPRYHNVIQMFRDRWARFELFIREVELGTIEPLQYEITYVNHIPQGEGWTTNNDVGKVFPDFAWRPDQERFLRGIEGINWRTTFLLPQRAGRLHGTIRRGMRREDKYPLLLFELTARGIGDYKTPEVMWAWFDLAHEWMVRAFTDLTGDEVQKKVWKRIR